MGLRTPLYDWHVAAGARMIEFGGWDMPLQYTGIVEEHLAVRRAAGLFDVSHMGKLLVEGRAAHAFLEGLSANTIPTVPGRARYTHLLREDGTTLDDVIVTCLAEDRFFVVCNAGPRSAVVDWLRSHLPPDAELRDLTETHLCLALQGPRAFDVLRRAAFGDPATPKPFEATTFGLRPVMGNVAPLETEGWGSRQEDPVMGGFDRAGETNASGGPRLFATRTGYTGEPGYELFPERGIGRAVWETLIQTGADLGLRPVGLGARDTLRLEKGYLLSGQDFDGHQTPLELNCAWIVKWDHPFVGREALAAQRDRADYPRLAGLRVEDRGIPRHGCDVLAAGAPVGGVTSGTLSPSLRVGIALARLDPASAVPGTRLAVDIRGTRHPAVVVAPPFL